MERPSEPPDDGRPLQSASPDAVEIRLARAKSLFHKGEPNASLDALSAIKADDLQPALATRLLLLRGLALSDAGKQIAAVACLRQASERARRLPVRERLDVEFALFSREADFQSPDESLASLTTLRQFVSSIGDAKALTNLHLAVARLDGLRGRCLDAHRHVETARRLAERLGEPAVLCSLELVEASLESTAGNLARATQLSAACCARAEQTGLIRLQLGAVANLALLALHGGGAQQAREYLRQVIPRSAQITYIHLAALDNLAQVELAEGRLSHAGVLLDTCASLARIEGVPARSWNDLASDLTRVAHAERLKDWRRAISIASAADDELRRRGFRALRTHLLSARVRCLARLGRQRAAEGVLAEAIETCPHGALDALIVLDATRGICLTLAGHPVQGSEFFERSLEACRAAGHRYYAQWIEQQRPPGTTVAAPPVEVQLPQAAAVLSRIAALVGAGRSLDILIHEACSLLRGAGLGQRLTVRAATVAAAAIGARCSRTLTNGTFSITVEVSDRQVELRVSGVHTLDELSTVHAVCDLVQTAVTRTTDGSPDLPFQGLWPVNTGLGEEDTIFRSPRMLEVLRVACRLAPTTLPVLITGETGTGKEILARLIHDKSSTTGGPFVPFNCSAIPRDLIESQLFGHRRGAFTGAMDSFAGIIRAAEGGTLFLDEVGDLDLAAQPKLLRFLESGEILPVGEVKARRVNVRVVAATNANLEELTVQGRFRADLYYRIGVATLSLPALRERKDEIPALAALFLARFAEECGRQGITLGDDFIAALLMFDWPGNVRQLANEVRRSVALARDGQCLRSEDLASTIVQTFAERPKALERTSAPGVTINLNQDLASAIADLEEKFIQHALEATGGRVSEAARLLGLSRKGLFLKRRRRGLVGERNNVN